MGFGLGSIASIWLPIIAVLVSITGFFGAGASTVECEAYRAQMWAIYNANHVAMANYQLIYKPLIEEFYSNPKSFVNFLLSPQGIGEGWGGVKNLRFI